jgi:hypothetical protein
MGVRIGERLTIIRMNEEPKHLLSEDIVEDPDAVSVSLSIESSKRRHRPALGVGMVIRLLGALD